MAKDYYFQPEALDSVLSENQVLALVHQHLPAAQHVTAVDETGGEARTYYIDDAYILKTQRPHQLRPRTSLKKEVVFLQQLEGVKGLNVPRVVGYGHPAALIEYTLMTRMPGIAFRNAKLDGDSRQKALKALGSMLHKVHNIPQEVLRESNLFFGDQSGVDILWRMGNVFDDLTEIIRRDGKIWNYPLAPEVIGRRVMRTLPTKRHIVALHSNPGPEHTFVDPMTGELTGIIDFGDAYFSHPVIDLRRYRAPADRAAILAGYLDGGAVDDDFMATWRVACAQSDITAIAFSPELQAAAAAELDQILSEI